MSIKPMPLINPRHFLKFHNLCPFHKSQPSHRNSRPLPTLCEMTLLIAVCVCLSGCSFTSNGIYGYTQSASRRTAEKKEALFEKRGERLYRAAISGIWYPFGWESPYLFVDIGAEHPVMLTSGKTFDYPTESGEKIQTCMECEVYYHNNGEDIFLGALESLNTGCPIAYDETGIYVAGAHGVEKYVIDESGAAPCLRMEIGSYRSEAGLYRSDTVNSTLSKNEYNRLYADYLSAKIIDYGDVLPFLYKYADEEIELLQLLEKEADCKITEYQYADFNHDGYMDIASAYKKDGLWHLLYLCGDEHVCLELETLRYDFCEVWSFPTYDGETYSETHLLVNVYDDAGADRHFSIYALKDHALTPVLDRLPGHVSMNDGSAINQTLFLNMEDCGDGYSAITYLSYEDGAYKELGILELPEDKFLQYDNAKEVLANIRAELGTDDIRFTFYAQQLSTIRIQCEITSESGEVRFCHFTLHHDKNELHTPSMYHMRFQTTAETQISEFSGYPRYNMHEGRLKSHFTDLEVTYPEID